MDRPELAWTVAGLAFASYENARRVVQREFARVGGDLRPDVVLIDVNMPRLNGFETLSEIKRVAPQVSVVMMTSLANDAVIARAQASGALAFLKKPF